MNIDEYVRTATDPDAWLEKSCQLRRSADLLWEAWFPEFLEVAPFIRWAKGKTPRRAYNVVEGYFDGAQMMYALAVETALKARILRDHPQDVTLEVFPGEDGVPVGAELRRLGVPLAKGHDLVALAEFAGVFDPGVVKEFVVQSDFDAVREILTYLGQVSRWSGRYPVPRRSGDQYRPPQNFPLRILGHFMRDWLDPLLNAYQNTYQTRPGDAPLADG